MNKKMIKSIACVGILSTIAGNVCATELTSVNYDNTNYPSTNTQIQLNDSVEVNIVAAREMLGVFVLNQIELGSISTCN